MKRFLLIICMCLCLLPVMAESEMLVAIDGFFMSVPKFWTATSTGNPCILLVSAPADSDSFQSNINVITETVPPNMSVDEYMDQSLKLCESIFSDFELLEKGDFFYVYSRTSDGIPLIQIQCIYMRYDVAYVVTCTTAESTYDAIAPLFTSCINSVDFIDN